MINLKSYHTLWTDAWKLFRKYAEMMPLTDKQWSDLVDESARLVDEHPEHDKMALRLVFEAAEELNRIEKEVKA